MAQKGTRIRRQRWSFPPSSRACTGACIHNITANSLQALRAAQRSPE